MGGNEIDITEVGIREGEKLDEVMITKNDSRSTFEYGKHYIIYPQFDWWKTKRHFTEGESLLLKGLSIIPEQMWIGFLLMI